MRGSTRTKNDGIGSGNGNGTVSERSEKAVDIRIVSHQFERTTFRLRRNDRIYGADRAGRRCQAVQEWANGLLVRDRDIRARETNRTQTVNGMFELFRPHVECQVDQIQICRPERRVVNQWGEGV